MGTRLSPAWQWLAVSLLAVACIGLPTAAHAGPGEPAKCATDADCPDEGSCQDGACGTQSEDAAEEPEAQPEPAEDEVEITERAREQFGRGVDLLEAKDGPDYAGAYEKFKKAYEESPSPKILGNLGVCAMNLERDGEAIEAIERYLAEVKDLEPAERGKLGYSLQVLKARVAPLELTVEPAGATVIDERIPEQGDPIVNRYGPVQGTLSIGIYAGEHRIRVERKDYDPEEWEFEISPGEKQVRKISLVRIKPKEPPPEPEPPPPPPPEPEADPMTNVWVMAGVTGALALGTIVVGSLALERKATYDDFAKGGERQEAEEARSQGEAMNVTTDVLLIATVASAAITAVLFFTAGPDEPATTTRLQITPAVGTHTGALFVQGSF